MTTDHEPPPELDRYSRQIRFAPLGLDGQRRLQQGRVLVLGCGALGTAQADLLVRAGVGFVRLVDRDFVELSNLQRQSLFDEHDVAEALPKAVAAARRLARINSRITIEPVVADVAAETIRPLAHDVDVIVDGTDNFETRYLINDLAVESNKPWVYGGCLGAEGQTMTILPGDTPCLRCVMEEPPPAGAQPTCDLAGVLGPIIHAIAAIQALEVLKILAGRREAVQRGLILLDLWENRVKALKQAPRDPAGCPCCGRREFPWLHGHRAQRAAVLCGRNAVQINPPEPTSVDLAELAARLAPLGTVRQNPFLIRFTAEPYVLTCFPDGRTIVSGTDDPGLARSLVARYLGA
jgi:adenylyltransferase/sulfurtransferase